MPEGAAKLMLADTNQPSQCHQRNVLAEVLFNVIGHHPQLPDSKSAAGGSLRRCLTGDDLIEFMAENRSHCREVMLTYCLGAFDESLRFGDGIRQRPRREST